MPILFVLPLAPPFIARKPVQVHHPEVCHVGQRNPWEAVIRTGTRDGPSEAHNHVPDVVEVACQSPIAGAKQVAALFRLDVVHVFAPNLVCAQVFSIVNVFSEVVLLDVRHPEQVHTNDVEGQPGDKVLVVVVERFLLANQVSHVGNGVVPGEPPAATIGQHPSIQVMAEVCSCQVGRFVPIVVKDVIPMREPNENRWVSDSRPIPLDAHRLIVLQGAPIVDRRHV
mmetsp:Transcript_58062/g.151340  ORF Transcript_58062/g.151340 Transcript_58062/m.151340 type:complete len:226 (-) Transcript_58062:910-1587(-)